VNVLALIAHLLTRLRGMFRPRLKQAGKWDPKARAYPLRIVVNAYLA
jgi:hypothetical protein